MTHFFKALLYHFDGTIKLTAYADDVNLYVTQFLYIYIYILSVYSPFSDRVGLPLPNTPFAGVLMKSIVAAFFDQMPFLTSTTCVGCNMCYVFNVNVTNSFDGRRSQCRLI